VAANGKQDVLTTLLGGVSKMPSEWSTELLDRMQASDRERFWEVSDRVVAYEYVESDLRAHIQEIKERAAAAAQ